MSEMDNETNNDPPIDRPIKEKLTVRFENLSIDNDTDLTDTDDIESNSTGNKIISSYFSNGDLFRIEDFIKLGEDLIGEKVNWRNQDISTLKEMLRNCE